MFKYIFTLSIKTNLNDWQVIKILHMLLSGCWDMGIIANPFE